MTTAKQSSLANQRLAIAGRIWNSWNTDFLCALSVFFEHFISKAVEKEIIEREVSHHFYPIKSKIEHCETKFYECIWIFFCVQKNIPSISNKNALFYSVRVNSTNEHYPFRNRITFVTESSQWLSVRVYSTLYFVLCAVLSYRTLNITAYNVRAMQYHLNSVKIRMTTAMECCFVLVPSSTNRFQQTVYTFRMKEFQFYNEYNYY